MQRWCLSRWGLHGVPSLCPPPGDHLHTARLPCIGPQGSDSNLGAEAAESQRAALGRPRGTFNPPPRWGNRGRDCRMNWLKTCSSGSDSLPGPGVVRGWRHPQAGRPGAAGPPACCRPPAAPFPLPSRKVWSVRSRHATYPVRQRLHTPSSVLLSRN